ncbi:hypothetical protein NE235_22480 [Actinoallomurus spadix]|uniref:hypothetical protein n=1 Tax=Actinoallomurus spadix TaxID=79912 RepID=UPI002092B24E|nr:hypothetical protein [Actinoallomurus spadix]MCO5988876.1 hypothetical protein [Actinoallomurus spadix]
MFTTEPGGIDADRQQLLASLHATRSARACEHPSQHAWNARPDGSGRAFHGCSQLKPVEHRVATAPASVVMRGPVFS